VHAYTRPRCEHRLPGFVQTTSDVPGHNNYLEYLIRSSARGGELGSWRTIRSAPQPAPTAYVLPPGVLLCGGAAGRKNGDAGMPTFEYFHCPKQIKYFRSCFRAQHFTVILAGRIFCKRARRPIGSILLAAGKQNPASEGRRA
jgi:hypothetical protein